VSADQTLAPPEPLPDVDSVGFWDAARQGKLVISRCQDCRRWQHPPQERCRLCGGPVAFEPVSGRGTIYSFILVRQATVPGHQVPYVVAQVELIEQPGLRLTGVVRGDVDTVECDQAVEVCFGDPSPGGFRAPEFARLG
jgi:uncharacterized OB-fold protein